MATSEASGPGLPRAASRGPLAPGRNVPLLLAAWLIAGMAGAFSCTQEYNLDYDNEPRLEPPTQAELASWLEAYRSGRERWRGDPKAVADVAIREYLDVPWKADPFDPAAYEVNQNKEWGAYVVRGYKYPTGMMRYRVKIRPYREIWYPVQVSRYKKHELPHPALEKDPR